MKQSLKIHFISELLRSVREEGASELYATEIIKKNQIIASKSIPDPSDGNAPGTANQIDLVPGKNCGLSEDGEALQALVTGYAFMESRQNGRVLSVQVDMIPLVQVQEDNMQASLTLYPAPSGKEQPGQDELEAILREEGICYGIDRAMLGDCVKKLADHAHPATNIPIARGVLPIDGKDAYLRFEVETGPIPGKILRDGTIDFRERRIFTGVDADQLIAVRVPETGGTPGINVFGESIAQRQGKDISIKISGDVSYSPETGQVLAAKSGVLSTVKGTDITVSAKQTIPGDVDFSVGNIESKDCVDIKGSVQPGFSVKTKGDLRIGGNVEGATILCKGNAVVQGGLLGEHCRLETQGDADVNFTERAEIVAGGKIIIRKGAYYSRITGDDSILCSPGSKMVGCVICCAGNFTGGDVGSHQAGPAVIAAGVDGRRYDKYQSLKQQILAIEETLEVLRNRENKNNKIEEIYQEYESELRPLQEAFRKLNLIPKTSIYSRNEPAFRHSQARITVHGTAAAATKLRIGNLTKTLDDACSAVEFFIDTGQEQIVARNLY